MDWEKVVGKKMRPPIEIDINKSYVHSEFLDVEIPFVEEYREQCLFEFFYYVNPLSLNLFEESKNVLKNYSSF